MSELTQIHEKIDRLTALVAGGQGKYLSTDQAIGMLPITNERKLKKLRELGHLVKFHHDGFRFWYLRDEVEVLGARLFNKEITV